MKRDRGTKKERETQTRRAWKRERGRERDIGTSEGGRAVVEGRERGWSNTGDGRKWRQRERKRGGMERQALTTSTFGALALLDAILIPINGWCMVCYDGSNSGIPGLKLA